MLGLRLSVQTLWRPRKCGGVCILFAVTEKRIKVKEKQESITEKGAVCSLFLRGGIGTIIKVDEVEDEKRGK